MERKNYILIISRYTKRGIFKSREVFFLSSFKLAKKKSESLAKESARKMRFKIFYKHVLASCMIANGTYLPGGEEIVWDYTSDASMSHGEPKKEKA